MTDTPKTLLEAVRYFSDLDTCHAYLRKIRWPRGVQCPHCDGKRCDEVRRRRLLCKDCRKEFSDKVGTIFEDSPLGLDKWFVACWSVANCKNGISSHELARALGVTQKTAWFMEHRIRKAMEVGGIDKFDGPAEADTSYVGGKAANMHKDRREKVIRGRGAAGKTAIHGILQRSDEKSPSQVQANVIGSEDAQVLLPAVRRQVRYGAQVFTDAAHAYGELCFTHLHQAIDHSIAYARGAVHTNGLENFWSLLKRALGGTYVAVAPFHLQSYVAEQAFRFNGRKSGDGGRFEAALEGTIGKRLTYRVLTGQQDAGFMGLK
jgi:transposase-like protein